MNSEAYRTLLEANQRRLTKCHEAMQALIDKENALRDERRRLSDAFVAARHSEQS